MLLIEAVNIKKTLSFIFNNVRFFKLIFIKSFYSKYINFSVPQLLVR